VSQLFHEVDVSKRLLLVSVPEDLQALRQEYRTLSVFLVTDHSDTSLKFIKAIDER